MTQRVCFLFNHEDVHQVAHTLPVALELAGLNADIEVEIAVSTADQATAVTSMIQSRPTAQAPVVRLLDLSPLMEVATSALSRIVPARRVAILGRHLDYFQSFDVLVVPEFTTTLLRSRWKLTRPLLVCIPHGSGDRSVGFSDELRLFDRVLVAGEKTRGRMLERHSSMADKIKVCGYPKFDAMDLTRKPRLFDDDKPVVVYNPHFDPLLSSWYRFGPQILDYFAQQSRYNFVFAPHVMLFRKLIHGSLEHRRLHVRGTVPKRLFNLPHMLIDTGSVRSVDMTYTLAGDIYLGDASSQIYEWIIRPRPAIFINGHDAKWQDDPNYAHWHLGRVIDDLNQMEAALRPDGGDVAPMLDRQRLACAQTFSFTDMSASQRCAAEIRALLT
jgi:hypothetical protein